MGGVDGSRRRLLVQGHGSRGGAQRGYLLAFMGKPITDRGGSGIHVNFSLGDDNGENAFADLSAQDDRSPLARHAPPHRQRSCPDVRVGIADGQNAYSGPPGLASMGSMPTGALITGGWHSGPRPPGATPRGWSTDLPMAQPGFTWRRPQPCSRRCAGDEGLECPSGRDPDCITGADADVTVPEALGAKLDAPETDKDFVEAFSPAYVEGVPGRQAG